MDMFSFLYVYLFCGLLMALWVLLSPQTYVEKLRYAVIILKTASIKLKAKEDKKPPIEKAELRQKQTEYVQKFDNQIQEDSENIYKNPIRYNFTILIMIFGWILIAFIFVLAWVFKYTYLESHELP